MSGATRTKETDRQHGGMSPEGEEELAKAEGRREEEEGKRELIFSPSIGTSSSSRGRVF